MMKLLRTALAGLTLLALCATGALAQFSDQRTWGGTSGGSANVQTVTIPNLTAHLPGVPIRFVAGFSNTSATTFNPSGIGAVAVNKPTPSGIGALTGGEIVAGRVVTVAYDGSVYQLIGVTMAAVPTYQLFTVGSGTYTTPAGVVRLKIKMVGGGASGAPGPATSTFNGLTGATSSFGSTTALGGVGATNRYGGVGGSGGVTTTGTLIQRIAGASGGNGPLGSGFQRMGGLAGGTCLAPGGPAIDQNVNATQNPPPAPANSGSGTAGGAANISFISQTAGGGGGGGECVEFQVASPSATYSYTVGAGGVGVVNPGNGVDSTTAAAGRILVEEFYQ